MNRLTQWFGSDEEQGRVAGLVPRLDGVYFPEELIDVLLAALAAYEDTGLSPEEVTAIKHSFMGREIAKITEFDGVPIQRLKELSQADKDEQLVVLPCKVGDTVYVVFSNGIRPYIVDRIYVIASNEVQVRMRFNLTEILHLSGIEFGKSVFLTYEAAKLALDGDDAKHGKV